MSTVDVVIKQVSSTHYAVSIDGEIVCQSRTPFLSAARALLQRGVSPDTELRMLRDGSPVVAMRSTVGQAAHWTVEENERASPRFRPYRAMADRMPFPGGRGRSISADRDFEAVG